MSWTYSQRTGQLRHNGTLVSTGYSGAGTQHSQGRNNADMQATANAGPIPRGQWLIGAVTNSAQTGPNVLPLRPIGHNAFGRTAFQVHGNNSFNNASHGCIVLPLSARQLIANSGDNVLHVQD
ncbi:MAG: DUF2778 domain-containing protein [Pirellulaceae bacterium]|nr:DUF2778 domain-containing protein [Pirellulaceae bacterium]